MTSLKKREESKENKPHSMKEYDSAPSKQRHGPNQRSMRVCQNCNKCVVAQIKTIHRHISSYYVTRPTADKTHPQLIMNVFTSPTLLVLYC